MYLGSKKTDQRYNTLSSIFFYLLINADGILLSLYIDDESNDCFSRQVFMVYLYDGLSAFMVISIRHIG